MLIVKEKREKTDEELEDEDTSNVDTITHEELSQYDKVIEDLFFKKYPKTNSETITEFPFLKTELVESGESLGIKAKNVPDIIYTYRSRGDFPEKILKTGNWIIEPRGKGKYAFVKINKSPFISIQDGLSEIEILNSLPEIVEDYSAEDEQGLLSSIRYNRLIDIFTKVTCFPLQSHIRTTIKNKGQIEIDEIYVGIDREGKKYIFPLEAKSPQERDKLGWVQITSMVEFAKQNFPDLICRPICAKPIDRHRIFFIEFKNTTEINENGIKEIRLYHLIRKK